MGIIQIAMIGIGAVALALMVKQQKSEYALYLSLSAVVLILVFSMNRLQVVMETIRKIEQYTGIDVAMLKILVKLMGITYVAEFASGICKDAGFSAIGSQIEMFAKFSIMAVSVPVLLTLLETIEGLLSTWKKIGCSLRRGAHCPGDNGFAPTETECRLAEMRGFA